MAIRRVRPLTFSPAGCTDAIDGTNAPRGSMAQLLNLVPSPGNRGIFVCRPAIAKKIDFVTLGFSSPTFVSSLLVVGNLAYGTIATSRNSGHDEPFCVNVATGANITVAGVTAGNTPVSPPSSGAWTPPIIAQIGGRVLVTHPGFPGGAVKFGWFDVSAFSVTLTGTTHNTTTIDGFTAGTLLGVQPGMTITGTGIPANTTVVSTGATSILMSAAATNSTSVAVTIAGGTLAAPLWGAGDTDKTNLPSVPVGVCLGTANNAVFALGANGQAFSDPGFPCRITNSPNVQFVVSNDGLATTAVYPLMLSAPLVTTGIVQAVLGFKGTNKIEQMTGDPSTGNLVITSLPVATGTASPLSITGCELGTAFISPEGLRIVQFNGTISPPIGDAGTGITQPFIYSAVPSRVCGAAGSHTLRYSVANGYLATTPFQEWWYDIGRQIWTGPMSLVPSLIQPWQGMLSENTFIVAPCGINASLWQADVVPSLTASYTENGVDLTWAYQPTALPDTGALAMYEIIEMALAAAFDGMVVDLSAADINGDSAETTIVPIDGTPPESLFGVAVFGVSKFGGGAAAFQQWPVYWPGPLVFKQLAPMISGKSSGAIMLGNLYMGYKQLRYSLPVPSAA